MGSSGGYNSERFSYKSYVDKIQQTNDAEKTAAYETGVASIFAELLGQINNRDTAAITKHVSRIKTTLSKELEEEITTNFGGSLARNTHINGLSDVDVLCVLNQTYSKENPQDVIKDFAEILGKRFPDIEVRPGDTAVTLSFEDMDIQILPALKYKTGIKIPDENQWSEIVRPKEFAQTLTTLNQQLGGKLVPTVKLAKAIISKLPEHHRMTGYHIESLAVNIFTKNPPDSLKYKDLLKEFFKQSALRVKSYIKDETGQSDNVDDYLGAKNSLHRTIVSNYLDRIAKKMDYADISCIQTNWREILDF